MKSIAVITARGGSKRIPKKNIKDFCGKPIIAYSIKAAIESELFDEVMVSTDSEEIATIARQYGASVPFLRSENTSNDYATTEDVLFEVLSRYEQKGKVFDVICCLYPTAPFVTPQKLKEAYKLLIDNDCYSVVPVVRFGFPPQRGLIQDGLFLGYLQPEHSKTRSQDLVPIYHDCGQFYFCRTKQLEKEKDLFTSKTIPYIVKEEEVQDIDNISDWVIAEMKYEFMTKRGC